MFCFQISRVNIIAPANFLKIKQFEKQITTVYETIKGDIHLYILPL